MTAFKPGDRVKPRNATWTGEVLATHEDFIWVIGGSKIGPGRPLSYLAENFEEVVPFFEVGKRYAIGGETFEPVRIDTDTDGSRTAYGKWAAKGGSVTWYIANSFHFKKADEVKDD